MIIIIDGIDNPEVANAVSDVVKDYLTSSKLEELIRDTLRIWHKYECCPALRHLRVYKNDQEILVDVKFEGYRYIFDTEGK